MELAQDLSPVAGFGIRGVESWVLLPKCMRTCHVPL
jgi:hypothetical protein